MTINALSIIPTKTASCSVMGDYAIKKKMHRKWGEKKRGDIVLFDFNHNGTSDHTGILVSVNKDGTIVTIEGNTGSGNNTNGGQVQKRTRKKSDVNYFVRPNYSATVTADMIIATAEAELGIKESPKNSNNVKYNTWYYGHAVKGSAYPWCMAFVCWIFAHVKEPAKPITKPTGKYSGTIPAPTLKKGSKGEAVKNLQKFLTWYGIKLTADGEFGSNTDSALRVFQKTEGIGVDGEYGNQSYTKAKAYATTPTKPTTSTTPSLKKPTGKYSGTIPNPTLKKGSKGTSVKNLQKFLNWYGGFKLSVDGGFGDKTYNALKTFQKTEGISADGIYGKASQTKAKNYKATTQSSTATKPTTPSVGTTAQKLIAQMDKLAWKYGTAKSKYAYKTGAPTSACKTAMNKHGYKTKAKYSDCGNFVNTVVRESGIDPKFTSLHGVKKAFPKSETKFNIVFSGKAIPSGVLKAGDIIRYKKTNSDQHAMFYYGDGKVCDAGHYNRFGNIRKDEKRYAGSKVKKSTIQVLRAKE